MGKRKRQVLTWLIVVIVLVIASHVPGHIAEETTQTDQTPIGNLANLTETGKEQTVNLQFRHNLHLERPRHHHHHHDHHSPLELPLGSEIAFLSNLVPYSYDYLPQISPSATIADPIVQDLERKVARVKDRSNRVTECPFVKPPVCDTYYWFRQASGACNNLNITWYGETATPFKRLLDSNYQDGRGSPRVLGINGRRLTNPKEIADKIHYPRDEWRDWTNFFATFGQFAMHDISHIGKDLGINGQVKDCFCHSTSPECFNIPLPRDEKRFREHSCLIQVRARDSREDFNCDLGPREQTNLATAWLDLGNVYGNTKEDQSELRTFHGGRLAVSHFKDSQGPLLPSKCTATTFRHLLKSNVCFVAGDDRVNSNIMLTGMHTIWVRQHNLLVTELARVNPFWDDERLYQEGKRIVTAMYQNIVYTEWLPMVIGYELHKIFNLEATPYGYFCGYNPAIYPNTPIELAAAAGRFGHAMIPPWFSRFDSYFQFKGNESLKNAQFNPELLVPNDSFDQFMRGCLVDKALQNFPHINRQLHDFALDDNGNDNDIRYSSLPALNINRGRDVGLASYAYYRNLAGLNFPNTFDELSWISPPHVKRLKTVYKDVVDIDLFTGGLSEYFLRGPAAVGPTFGYIIARTFRDKKFGDRYFYENDPTLTPYAFTLPQLNSIKAIKFSAILCNTLNLREVALNAFVQSDTYQNKLVPCKDIYQLNLGLFKDTGYPGQSFFERSPSCNLPSTCSGPAWQPMSSTPVTPGTTTSTTTTQAPMPQIPPQIVNPYVNTDPAGNIYANYNPYLVRPNSYMPQPIYPG